MNENLDFIINTLIDLRTMTTIKIFSILIALLLLIISFSILFRCDFDFKDVLIKYILSLFLSIILFTVFAFSNNIIKGNSVIITNYFKNNTIEKIILIEKNKKFKEKKFLKLILSYYIKDLTNN